MKNKKTTPRKSSLKPEKNAKKWFLADFHVHTNFNDGLNSVKEMVRQADKKGLEFLAITDHNMISGGFEAQKFAQKNNLKIKIIIGE